MNGGKHYVLKHCFVIEKINDKITNTYTYKGTFNVAYINSLHLGTAETGWVYNISDEGFIQQGGFSVTVGDNIAWTGSDWDKLSSTINISIAC